MRMAPEMPPPVSRAELEAAKTYRAGADTIMGWHTVTDNKASWLTIADENAVPVDKLIACNFPGAVVKGKIVLEVVNRYLGNHGALNVRRPTTARTVASRAAGRSPSRCAGAWRS